ncbi:MAG: TetR/AcrR family transcriptional regulator [Methanocorpusculum sp.]|nr:TetR/AcrR family transcriptional regulator [Methanocorpusculum sp.]
MLAEKTFADVSITEITVRAGIGRGTYYKHYSDKYALLDAIENRILCELDERLGYVSTRKYSESIRQKILLRYQYFSENIDTLRILFGPNGDVAFQQRMRDNLWKGVYIEDYWFQLLERRSGISLEYISAINNMASVIFEIWLQKDEPESPEEMVELTVNLTDIMKQILID